VRLTYITAAWIFVIDQLTKFIVVQWLDLKTRQIIEVWDPVLVLRMAWNEGINFGILGGADLRWYLIALALGICGFVLVWVRKEGGGRLVHLSAGLLIGGALGNVVDRVVYGAVADFLNMSCCGIENPYAFNVADISIFAGAIGLILFTGRDDTSAKKTP
jgi:signal peptidase II